jgi:hypothetical protein
MSRGSRIGTSGTSQGSRTGTSGMSRVSRTGALGMSQGSRGGDLKIALQILPSHHWQDSFLSGLKKGFSHIKVEQLYLHTKSDGTVARRGGPGSCEGSL